MSNLKYLTERRTRAVAAILLVCFLPLQIPRICVCHMLETPCTSGCPCAAQSEVRKRQCPDLEIAGTYEMGDDLDTTDHPEGDPKRECRCKSSSPIAVTKFTMSAELDLECRMLIDQGEAINRTNSSHLSISSGSIVAYGRYSSLERCVAMCRLTL